MDRYDIYGVFFGVVGIILTFYGFYLIGNAILESAGIAFLIIGLAFILTVPEEPTKTVSSLANEVMKSLESLSSSLSEGSRIVYESRNGGVVAVISVSNNSKTAESDEEAKQTNAQALEFLPVGATLANRVERGDDYQQTLKKILVEEAALASGCDALIDLDGGYRILVQEPVTAFLEPNPRKTARRSDSPLAQLCASVFARCTGERIVVKEESRQGGSARISVGFAES